MRITVEIDENVMNEIQRITGEKKQSPAVAKALRDYLTTKRRDDFLQSVLSGATDFSATNDEVEAMTALEDTTQDK